MENKVLKAPPQATPTFIAANARAASGWGYVEPSIPDPFFESKPKSPVDKNPQHREDFNRLLGAAAKKRPQDD